MFFTKDLKHPIYEKLNKISDMVQKVELELDCLLLDINKDFSGNIRND